MAKDEGLSFLPCHAAACVDPHSDCMGGRGRYQATTSLGVPCHADGSWRLTRPGSECRFRIPLSVVEKQQANIAIKRTNVQ